MNRKSCHLLWLLLAGCGHDTPPTPAPRPALVMTVGAPAEKIDMALTGEIKPRYESVQGFRISGKIVAREVDTGDRVKKGQIIARLDPMDNNLNEKSAKANVQSAKANRDLAAAELARYQSLIGGHFVSASTLDVKKAELKAAQARLEQAQSQAEVFSNQTRYSQLTADRTGVVTSIKAEPGQVVDTGDAIVRIADTENLEVSVAVPESRMQNIAVESPAKIRLWAKPDKVYAGKVREITPAADSATRAFDVRISILDPDDSVKLGMTARARLDDEPSTLANTYLLPSSAVTEKEGKPSVWVIGDDNKARARIVKIGPFTESGIAVDGLQAGERIAVAGVHTLVQEQIVTPLTPPSSP